MCKNNWVNHDGIFVDEKNKEAFEIYTYGDNDEYFISQSYYYKDDFYNYDGDKSVLINELITEDNTLEDLIKRTKNMMGVA